MPSRRSLASAPLAVAVALMPFSMNTDAAAGDDRREWQFSESNDPGNKGRTTARLTFGVAQTGDIQATSVCDATRGTSAGFSSLRFRADVGALGAGKDVDVRFSGGGFDHVLKGHVHRAPGQEGANGVDLAIGSDDPLWRAMTEKDSRDYLVPGYRASTLSFERGKDNIQQYVTACRTYAGTLESRPGGQATSQPADGGHDGAEKEAFASAKELGTIEAWEAFLSNYPTGFRADLARAYVSRLDGENAGTRSRR